MKSVKIIHTGDLHIGSKRTQVPTGKTEIENTFLNILDLCKTESVDFLLIAGDLFDSPYLPPSDAERIISAMAQIPETIIAISPGNHDSACPGSIYLKHSFPKNVVVFTSFMEYIDFPEKGVRLHGAAFTDRFEKISLLQNAVPHPEFINLGVIHGDLVSDGSSSSYNPITPSAISACGFDYLAIGHIHKRTTIEKLGKTHFSYCGCPDGMGFDELGAMGVYMGTVSNNGCNLSFVETSSRKYIIESFDVTPFTDSFGASEGILSHIKSKFGEAYAKNLYRINLAGTLPASTTIDPWQIKRILSKEVHFIDVFDCTETDISDMSALESETSLRGIFVKKMLEKISAASEDEASDLTNALKLGLKAFSKGVKLNDN